MRMRLSPRRINLEEEGFSTSELRWLNFTLRTALKLDNYLASLCDRYDETILSLEK